MRKPKVSIVIPTYNSAHLIVDTLKSCMQQDYPKIEVIIYDDCSTDQTKAIFDNKFEYIKYYRGKENVGVGEAFNRGIEYATGDIIVLMCSDDLFTNRQVVSDIVERFELSEKIGYVTRYYYQFIGENHYSPVRAWRDKNPIILANNPSGLAFRKEALDGCKCSNKMFIETSSLASQVLRNGWAYSVIPYDTVAARAHGSTSTNKAYWLKRRVSSPVMDWCSIGGSEIAKDYVSLIQIKNGFTMSAVVEEIINFVKCRPMNLFNPFFWFWSVVALIVPRGILRKLPNIYRTYLGGAFTKRIERF